MQLLDVILGQSDVRPGREDQFHDLGVTRDFLFVADDGTLAGSRR